MPFLVICGPHWGSFAVRDHLRSYLGNSSSQGIICVRDHLRCCTVLRLQEYIGYLTVINSTIFDCPKLRLTCSLKSFSS